MDSLVQWFTANLSGVISKEAIIFIISMIPILELRGGLLAASPALLNVPILRAIPICIVGNILPSPHGRIRHRRDRRLLLNNRTCWFSPYHVLLYL